MSSYTEIINELRDEARSKHIPLEGGIEITSQCNFKCIHCYLSKNNPQFVSEECFRELIDSLVAEGCLYLTITGGEPFLHPKVLELHKYAREAGLLTLLFTNGSLIDEEAVAQLTKNPPAVIEISVYGLSPETYEKVTGSKEAYYQVIRAIKLVSDAGLPLHIKTVLLEENYHDFKSFISFAEQEKLTYHFEAVINPTTAGDLTPLTHRLSVNKIIQVDLMDPMSVDRWIKFFYGQDALVNSTPEKTVCNAGDNIFLIDSDLKMHPCVMWRTDPIDISKGKFTDAWHRDMPCVSNKKYKQPVTCQSCRLVSACNICPAWSNLEEGDQEKPLKFLCEVTHARYNFFKNFNKEGANRPNLTKERTSNGGYKNGTNPQEAKQDTGRICTNNFNRFPSRKTGCSGPRTQGRGKLLQQGSTMWYPEAKKIIFQESSESDSLIREINVRLRTDLKVRTIGEYYLLVHTTLADSDVLHLLNDQAVEIWEKITKNNTAQIFFKQHSNVAEKVLDSFADVGLIQIE